MEQRPTRLARSNREEVGQLLWVAPLLVPTTAEKTRVKIASLPLQGLPDLPGNAVAFGSGNAPDG